jgi:membrane protein YdbS with pleckstrin-like domain
MQKLNDIWGTLGTVAMVAGLVGMFVGLIGFAIAFLLWKTEEYIITNERILRIEGIVNKNETATALEKINDVETHQSLIGRLFGYGNVMIQTGSDQGINKLDFLAKPQEFKKIMLNAKNKIYGDASDLAPGGRVYEDDEGQVRRVRPQVQVYDVPPPQAQPRYPQQSQYYEAQPQPTYNDPRGGYAPRPQPPMPSQGPTSAAQIAEAIQQLARLRDSGAISEAEFQAKKNDLMSRM